MQSLADQDNPPRKSLATAYALLGAFGTFGVHKFYLGRPVEGLVYACTLGLCFVGTFIDFFTLPEKVKRANARPVGGLLPKLLHVADDPPSSLSDPDAVVARYLRQERAERATGPSMQATAGPAGFGRRKRTF